MGGGHTPNHNLIPPIILQVAYRGRVLLELSTHMGTPDGRQRGTIALEDIARVQVGTRGHRAMPPLETFFFKKCHLAILGVF